MATYVPAKRAAEFIFYVGLVDQADTKLFKANPTLATGDVKVSKDGGALANITTLPTVTPAAGRMVKVTLSVSEMTADNVTVVFNDASGAEWNDLIVNIQTAANQIDDIASAVSTVDTVVDSILADTGTDGVVIASGAITAATIATDAIDADALAADAIAEINATVDTAITDAALATAANLATVDTVVDAIKAVTDLLPDAGALSSIATAAALATVDSNVDSILADTGTDGVVVSSIAADAVNASALATDAVSEIQSGLATAAKLLAYIQLLARKDAAIAVDNATELGEINANGGSGIGAYDNATESVEAIRDRGDAEWTAADVSSLATAANLATVDTVVDAIKAVTDNLPDSGALTTITNNVAAILADTGTDGVAISTAVQQSIADELLKRGVDNVEATASAASLTELILLALESSATGTTLTIRKTDGTTFSTKTLTTDDTAEPITGIT